MEDKLVDAILVKMVVRLLVVVKNMVVIKNRIRENDSYSLGNNVYRIDECIQLILKNMSWLILVEVLLWLCLMMLIVCSIRELFR